MQNLNIRDSTPESKEIKELIKITLVNVYVDLLVFKRIAGSS